MNNAVQLHTDRIQVRNYLDHSFQSEISKDVFNGLSAPRKSIPCKYFYDERGSMLFDKICLLSEYYQTRTEMALLNKFAPCIMNSFKTGNLVELGSGSNKKIQTLLCTLDKATLADTHYMPVDVSESTLVASAEELIALYRELRVVGIIADFTKQMDVIPSERSKLIVFLGSTIGNLEEEDSHDFLKNVAQIMKPEDRCLIGIDMVKEKSILEDAYNDRLGITSEFNKNILSVVNRELKADFDLSHFDHLAFFNEEEEQIEMHLQANRNVTANIQELHLQVKLKKGETIFTEISRKFQKERAEQMFSRAGMAVTNWFSDPMEWFSLIELAPYPNY